MDYTRDDFLFKRTPFDADYAEEETATCRHCGERYSSVGNSNGDAVWMRVQHDPNCRLMKASNEAAESKR